MRVVPATGDAKLTRAGLAQRLTKQPLAHKRPQRHGGVDGGVGQRGTGGVEFGHGEHGQVLGLAADVGAAGHQHHRLQAARAQVVGAGHAAPDLHVAGQGVERKALVENISEIQQQPARQGLQAEHAQQPGRAGIGLQKPAFVDRQHQLALQRGDVEVQRRAVPAQVALDLSGRPQHQLAFAKALQQSTAIADVEVEVQRRAPPSPRALGLPAAGGAQRGVRVGQHQAVQPPFTARAAGGLSRAGGVVRRGDRQPAQPVAAQLEVFDLDVERGHAGGGPVQQPGDRIGHGLGVAGRQRQARQARQDAARTQAASGLPVVHAAGGLVGLTLYPPALIARGRQALHIHADPRQAAPADQQLGRLELHALRQPGGQIGPRAHRARRTGWAGGGRVEQGLPGVQIELRQRQHRHAAGHRLGQPAAIRQRGARQPGAGFRAGGSGTGRGGDATRVDHQTGLQGPQLQPQPVLLQAAPGVTRRQCGRAGAGGGQIGGGNEAHPQRGAGLGRLAQRRRQRNRQPLQRTGQLPFSVAALQAQQGLVAGLALQALRQAHQRRAQLWGVAQAVGAGGAGQRKTQPAIDLGTTVDLQLATGQLAAQAHYLHALVADVNAAFGPRQQRQVSTQAQVVAGQGERRFDLGLIGMRQRNGQRQTQLSHAGGAGLRQGLTGPVRQRRAAHIAQQIASGPADLAFERELRLRRQLGDAPRHVAQRHAPELAAGLLEAHRIALEHQAAVDRTEGRPRRLPGRRIAPGRHRGNRGQGGVQHLRGESKFTVAAVHEWEVPEVALHLVGHFSQLTSLHRAPHPVAGDRADAQRQVTRHLLGPALAERAAQGQHAGQTPALAKAVPCPAVPGGVERAARVGVVEAGVLHRQFDPRQPLGRGWTGRGSGGGWRHASAGPQRLDLPFQLGAEVRQQHTGRLENPRQLNRAIDQRQPGLAASFGRGDVQIGPTPARPANAAGLGRGRGGNRQALHFGAHTVVAGRIQRAVPLGLQGLHRALRIELHQQAPQAGAYGQAFAQFSEQGQVQAVGAEAAPGHRVTGVGLRQAAGLGLLPLCAQLAGGPALALAGGECQPLDAQLDAGGRAFSFEMPAQLGKGQGFQPHRQPHRNGPQRGVQRDGIGQALVEVNPGPQRSLALLQIHRQIDVPAQAVDIHLRQIREQAALPALPVAGPCQQRATGQRAHRKALAPIGRRRGVQAQFMTMAGVAHHQQHIAQLQRRRGALLVHPAQHATPDDEFALLEEPIGRRAAVHRRACGLHTQARHVPAALRVAPHLQARVLDQELIEAQAQAQQRARRQRRRHQRQPQRFAPLGIAQHHVTQRKSRHPAAAAHADAANLHRMPQRPAGLRLDPRTPSVQTGQNQPMQAEPSGQPPGQQHRRATPQDPPCPAPTPPDRTARSSGD